MSAVIYRVQETYGSIPSPSLQHPGRRRPLGGWWSDSRKSEPPKAVVVFESMWGNTERIARAVAAGLADSMKVEVFDVAALPGVPADDVALVVLGGPTHAFSMSRGSTRADAVNQGARQSAAETGLREWLDTLPSGRHGLRLATFDTRIHKFRHVPGSAAKSAAKAARRRGYSPATVESFYVSDIAGPLVDGEIERATAWGRHLATALVAAG